MGRPIHHVLHLELHHQRYGDQEYRQDILGDDEHFVEGHLVLAAEGPLDDVDGFVTGCPEGRKKPAEGSEHQNPRHISCDVTGSHHKLEFHLRLHRKPAILGGQQIIHHRHQQLGQHQGDGKAYCRKGYRLADVLPEDFAAARAQQAARGHLFGPLAAECEAQVDIIEYG